MIQRPLRPPPRNQPCPFLRMVLMSPRSLRPTPTRNQPCPFLRMDLMSPRSLRPTPTRNQPCPLLRMDLMSPRPLRPPQKQFFLSCRNFVQYQNNTSVINVKIQKLLNARILVEVAMEFVLTDVGTKTVVMVCIFVKRFAPNVFQHM